MSSLDKLTLHHQMAIMDQNLSSLEAMIKQRTEEHRLLTEEIIRLNGARAYHNTLVDQLKQTLATLEKDLGIPPTTSSPTPQ